ncbi:hypothetical protein QM467_06825 [Rhodoblastus sp. 17X3]|uniref:hypothetical protein n=1 Tax=Rhodoblastus sp. 17X3 TaxID=3047026 RepID=UPI0024B809C7|nr:hypothetical protein [Rhodoblastus sp. 17X3]MDI9847765.1 hypothetical protein [Rhodoblastus sp. 17X3]
MDRTLDWRPPDRIAAKLASCSLNRANPFLGPPGQPAPYRPRRGEAASLRRNISLDRHSKILSLEANFEKLA